MSIALRSLGITPKLILTLFLCTSLTALLTAAGTARGAPSLADLTETRSKTAKTTVWIMFRAPDCGLSPELILRLNQVDTTRSIKVIGVMLFPPSDAVGQAALKRSLGMEFEMIYDVSGTWNTAIKRDRQRGPVLLIRDQVSILGSMSPQLVSQLEALSIADVPMERER